MARSQKNSGKIDDFEKNGGVSHRRRGRWRTFIFCVSCVILTATSLPQASADLSNETAVLLGIKQAWGNPSFLGTWSAQFNVCSQWANIKCNAQNSTIISLTLTGGNDAPTTPIYIPESIGALVNLEELDMESLGLTGNIPSTIGLLRNLRTLNFFHNDLNGTIPAEIGNLTKLSSLRLQQNQLSGSLPESLSKLPNLTYLSVSFNMLSGPIPEWIGNFPVLQELYLYENTFTGPLPPSIGNLSTLTILEMNSAWTSRLSSPVGPLPPELGKLASLLHLVLNTNVFQGSIPESLGNLTALSSVDLGTCSLTGTIPSSLGNLSNLISIDFSNNLLFGQIPEELGNAASMNILDLHSNFLIGSIPTQLSQLIKLTNLDLSYNSLDGEIPQKLVNLPDLEILNLQDNCLSGPIPNYNQSGALTSANFGQTGDSNCFNASQVCKCGGAPAPALLPPATAGGNSSLSKSENIYIAVGVVLGSLVALFGLLVFFFLRHKHQQKSVNPSSYKGPVRQYTLSQIKEATQNFTRKVGEGGFSTVYQAVFDDGIVAAAKRFNKKRPVECFEQEVQLQSSLNHRFLVNLVGYCEDLDAGEHILLYEFMDRGNLNENLHGCVDSGDPPLTWDERVRILVSVGQAIAYLHYGTDPPMIHRDIKSANILLSSSGKSLVAKLADFGLGRQTVVDADVMTATFGNEPPKAFSTRIAGTPGYFDPEYVFTSILSSKTDVYSYGVVLLELITGKPPLLEERSTLTEWAKPFLNTEDIWAILDPQLDKKTCNLEQVKAVAELAHRCTESDARNRPSIKEVVKVLDELFSAETGMFHPCVRSSSSNDEFSETDSAYSSQRTVLAAEIEMNSTNYTDSEILPRD